MSDSSDSHFYDLQSYIVKHGNIADKMRLISAGYKLPEDIVNTTLNALERVLNRDGGVPIDLIRGNPSSVKETAEMLPLLGSFKKTHRQLIQKMVKFLVSRQKADGGFAEALNLDPFIQDRYGMAWGRRWYPVGKSITWLTGKALEALCLADFDDEERLRRARDFLLHSQYEDGNWPDFENMDESDPMATGNVLSGLRAMDIKEESEVYQGARAALYHHLQEALENKSTYDMIDLAAVCPPETEKEREVVRNGLELILGSQNSDGGWSQLGSKKSDPELSSIIGFVLKKCAKYK
ncbi:MAG: prenyltransferase/squalene oxidase repeat-containing protein [Promethearchaeota archaeon]